MRSRENLTALMNLSGTWIDSIYECAPLDKLILDLDSSVSPTHGDQEGSAYNGYFERTFKTTKRGFSYSPWRTTSETSCGAWRCRGP